MKAVIASALGLEFNAPGGGSSVPEERSGSNTLAVAAGDRSEALAAACPDRRGARPAGSTLFPEASARPFGRAAVRVLVNPAAALVWPAREAWLRSVTSVTR